MSWLSGYSGKERKAKKPITLLMNTKPKRSGSYGHSVQRATKRKHPVQTNPKFQQEWDRATSNALDDLQKKYRTLIEGIAISLYEELSGGELFRCKHHVRYEFLDKSTGLYYWEEIDEGDMLMYVSQRIDEEGEIAPTWIITDMRTGDTRIRELYVASYKLVKLSKKKT